MAKREDLISARKSRDLTQSMLVAIALVIQFIPRAQ